MGTRKHDPKGIPAEICYECKGITYKLSGESARCIGYKSKAIRKTEHIPYESADEPLPPSGKYIALGRTVTTAKLEKENRPPISFGSGLLPTIVVKTFRDEDGDAPSTPNDLKDAILAAPSENNHNASTTPGESKVPPPSAREHLSALQRRKEQAKQANRSLEDILRKGAAIQYNALARTYTDITTNFPERAQSTLDTLGKGVRTTAGHIGRQISRVFGKDE